jgi:hypothetical protein
MSLPFCSRLKALSVASTAGGVVSARGTGTRSAVPAGGRSLRGPAAGRAVSSGAARRARRAPRGGHGNHRGRGPSRGSGREPSARAGVVQGSAPAIASGRSCGRRLTRHGSRHGRWAEPGGPAGGRGRGPHRGRAPVCVRLALATRLVRRWVGVDSPDGGLLGGGRGAAPRGASCDHAAGARASERPLCCRAALLPRRVPRLPPLDRARNHSPAACHSNC